MKEKVGFKNRRKFLELSLKVSAAALFVGCAEAESVAEKTEKVDAFLGQIKSDLKIERVDTVTVVLPKGNDEINDLKNELDKAVVAWAIPAVLEPSPGGELALVLLAGVAAGLAYYTLVENPPEMQFNLNQHSIDRRGEKLAKLIRDVVVAAFMTPEPKKGIKRKILCSVANGVIDGCDKAMMFVTEVVSRSKNIPGVMSVVFGHDVESNEWRLITTLYNRQGAKGTTLERYEQKMLNRSYGGDCPDGFPKDLIFQ